ncbi:MAG: TPM domain-containing protein [Candidatus Omnitrophota bacterium]
MMKRLNEFVITAIFCGYFLFGLNAFAVQDARVMSPLGFVNDYAGILPSDKETKMEALLTEIENKTSVEIAVVTLNTTVPLTIEQYAVDLFEKWGIGKKGKDNGILMLIAVVDRKVRIEVGYGLEGTVTDLQSKMIIQNLIVPAFKNRDYAVGILSAVIGLAELISNEYGIEISLDPEIRRTVSSSREKSSPLGSFLTLLFFLLIFGLRFGMFFFLMNRGSYWSGGGSGSYGGGFGGFGGGMSGGGGASGSW